jgi:hypothetical protein
MMTRFLKPLIFLVALAGGLPAALLAAKDETAPSAQTLLFDSTYLLPLAAPSRLLYNFSQQAADPRLYGQDFQDEVALRLSPSAQGDGHKDVLIDVFTGERQRVLGPLTQVSGNPVIMMFLERDMTQMNRQVGGQPTYFRNVIRLALREKAKLEPATFTWDGKQVTGTRISIQPFLDHPNGERTQLFRSKTYEFIVSDAVPGGIYEVHATVRDAASAAAPMFDSKLTLKGIAYDQPKN